jgi:hypothetical protein
LLVEADGTVQADVYFIDAVFGQLVDGAPVTRAQEVI